MTRVQRAGAARVEDPDIDNPDIEEPYEPPAPPKPVEPVTYQVTTTVAQQTALEHLGQGAADAFFHARVEDMLDGLVQQMDFELVIRDPSDIAEAFLRADRDTQSQVLSVLHIPGPRRIA